MRAAVLAAALLPAPAIAETLRCELETDCTGRTDCTPRSETVTFQIDRHQFSPPIDPKEPPRVKRITVRTSRDTFIAEPLIIGGTRGFWDDAEELGARILTALPDGTAKYTDTWTGDTMTGKCTELP